MSKIRYQIVKTVRCRKLQINQNDTKNFRFQSNRPSNVVERTAKLNFINYFYFSFLNKEFVFATSQRFLSNEINEFGDC